MTIGVTSIVFTDENGTVRAAAGQRDDVIDDMARPAVGVAGGLLELVLRLEAPLDPVSMRVTLGRRRNRTEERS